MQQLAGGDVHDTEVHTLVIHRVSAGDIGKLAVIRAERQLAPGNVAHVNSRPLPEDGAGAGVPDDEL